MKRLYAFANLALAALIWCAPAMAGSWPVLRPEVHTLSEIVTIGDFYENAGPFADAPLFRSPDLGTSGDVSADMVAKRAQAAGLLSASTNGLAKVVVYRRAETYDRQALEGLVRKALAAQDASLSAEDIDVSLSQAPATIHANPGAAEPVHVDRVLWSRPDGRFTLQLAIAGLNGVRNLTIAGYAREMVEVAALVQPLRRGAILKRADLTTIRLARNSVPARALTSPSDILGLAARGNLRASIPLTRNDFERPTLIPRGEKVMITYQLAGMKLTTRGQAAEDGAMGDVIDIMNLRSRRIVSATVIGRGEVHVDPPVPVVASLNERTQQ